MPQSHPPYPPEYRRRIVELACAPGAASTANAIRKWVKQAGLDEGLRSDENRVLREGREILAKAAAWFAQETGATPSRRSHS